MTDERRNLIRRIALGLAWVSALYGCALIIDGVPENDTAGWVFFLVPIALVIGERITRGDEEEEEPEAPSEGDDQASGPSA